VVLKAALVSVVRRWRLWLALAGWAPGSGALPGRSRTGSCVVTMNSFASFYSGRLPTPGQRSIAGRRWSDPEPQRPWRSSLRPARLKRETVMILRGVADSPGRVWTAARGMRPASGWPPADMRRRPLGCHSSPAPWSGHAAGRTGPRKIRRCARPRSTPSSHRDSRADSPPEPAPSSTRGPVAGAPIRRPAPSPSRKATSSNRHAGTGRRRAQHGGAHAPPVRRPRHSARGPVAPRERTSPSRPLRNGLRTVAPAHARHADLSLERPQGIAQQAADLEAAGVLSP
jgi:hypothetical protein